MSHQQTIHIEHDDQGQVRIADYRHTFAALQELREQYQGVVFDVTQPEDMKAAKAARQRLKKLRTSLETKRKELKAPVLAYTKALDGEAKAITADIVALESPIDEQIKAEEQRAAREKAEQEAAERARLDAIRQRIEAIRATPGRQVGASVAALEAAMNRLMADPLEGFAELEREAALVRDDAVAQLHDMLAPARQREAEQAELEELRRFKAEKEAAEREAQEQALSEAMKETPVRDEQVGVPSSVPPRGQMETIGWPEGTQVGVDPGAGDERTVEATVAPATRSPVLDNFLSQQKAREDRAATPVERWFEVEVEWSGYSRGISTYRVKAATAREAMESWGEGERISHRVVRDDTSGEAVEAAETRRKAEEGE